jgi:hypothetical protein
MAGILMDRYRFGPPLASAFGTKYDAGTGSDPTLTDSATSGLVMNFGAGSISNNTDYVKAATKAKASASSQDIIARVNFNGLFTYSIAGLCVADGTKLITFGFAATSNGAYGLKVDKWTNDTTFSSEPLSNYPISPQCEWLRIGVVSGDPKDFYVSHNGVDWHKVLSSSMTGFLTYTEVGLATFVNRNGAGSFPLAGTEQFSMSCLYFKDPDIDPGF